MEEKLTSDLKLVGLAFQKVSVFVELILEINYTFIYRTIST